MTSPATMRLMGLLVIVGMVAGCGDAPSSDAPVGRHAEARAKYGGLSGIIRTSDGALIGGVEVTAFPAGATIDNHTEPANMSVSSGEEFDAKVMGKDWGMVLEPGVYDVYARRGDVAMNRLRVAESVRITLGKQTVVNFSLPPLPQPGIPPWAKVAPEQIAEAKKHGVPVAFENDLGMKFVLIPAGTFLMGSPEDEEGRSGEFEMQHEVRIERPFYMQIREVTNGQVGRGAPPGYRGETDWQGVPIDGSSWDSAKTNAEWVTQSLGDRRYLLPTEAQWEYACRAGTTTAFYTGDDIGGADVYVVGETVISSIGALPPNRWGLHDMQGSVSEWCADRFGPYPGASAIHHHLPLDADVRVYRGCGRVARKAHMRSAYRGFAEASSHDLGFRLVSPLPEPGER